MFQDYVAGATELKEMIRSKKIYEGTFRAVRARILGVLIDIAEALRHLHEFGIMHQDVKSENVLIGSNGTALLADFGLAKHGEGSGSSLRVPFSGLTFGYESPEVRQFFEEIRDGSRPEKPFVTPSTHDMWSWAVVAMDIWLSRFGAPVKPGKVGSDPEWLRTNLRENQPGFEADWSKEQIQAWAQERWKAKIEMNCVAAVAGCDGAELLCWDYKDTKKGITHGAKARLRTGFLTPVRKLHSLLAQVFAESPADRPASMAEVLSVLHGIDASATSRRPSFTSASSERAAALHNLGVAFADRGERDDAIGALSSASNLGSSGAATRLGEVYLAQENTVKAQEAFTRALELSDISGAARARFGLGEIASRAGDDARAMEEWTAAMRTTRRVDLGGFIAPSTVAIDDGRGQLLRVGDYLRAFITREDFVQDPLEGRTMKVSSERVDQKILPESRRSPSWQKPSCSFESALRSEPDALKALKV